MVNWGKQKPGVATGARAPGRRSGTGPELPQSAGRKSSGGYAVAALAVLALWGAWSLGVVGCTASGSGYGKIKGPPGSFVANMRLSPGEISRLERNAHYYKLMGQPELGLKELELALQQNPDNLQITNFLAQNYEELGKFEAARQLYQEALTRRGSNPVMANNLCFSYYQEGRWQEAEKCFRQTLVRDPGNVSARNNLGLLYCRLGRQDEARRLWQEAEGIAAADAKMSQALAALGMPESAVYARKPETAPPAARATQTPTPAAAGLPAPKPAADTPLAKPVNPLAPLTPVQASPAAGVLPSAATAAKSSPGPVQSSAKLPEAAPALAPPVAAAAPAPEKPAGLIAAKAPKSAASEIPGDLPAPPAKALSQEAAGSKKLTRPAAAAAVKSSPGPVPSSVKLPEAAPAPAPPVAAAAPAPEKPAAPALVRPRLTAQELLNARILVVNGAGIPKLAHLYRALLSAEGFHVGRIGNHFDFGAENTTIYYLPEAEKVAQALQAEHFPHSRIASKHKLPPGAQIKLVLGHDLKGQEQVLAMK